MPLVAAQDLSESQKDRLARMAGAHPWHPEYPPVITHFASASGTGDLRARMLTESLKAVRTRYAAFLDCDDLLFPTAYEYLIDRLRQTGKAVTFGRVHVGHYDSVLQRIKSRTNDYTYGFSYQDFLHLNNAPIHSFMLDVSQINLTQLRYFDDQKYMEDYFLTLQIFDEQNADWPALSKGRFIGDYIHNRLGSNTLALTDHASREQILASELYQTCERRIAELQKVKRREALR